MLAKQNPYIESAYKKLQIISQDKEKRLEYEAAKRRLEIITSLCTKRSSAE